MHIWEVIKMIPLEFKISKMMPGDAAISVFPENSNIEITLSGN